MARNSAGARQNEQIRLTDFSYAAAGGLTARLEVSGITLDMLNHVPLKVVAPVGFVCLVVGLLMFLNSLGSGDGEFSISLIAAGTILVLLSLGIKLFRVGRRM